MSDAYVDWLALAPEGKFPTRLGTAENPTEYADAWGGLEAGVDRKAPLGEIYDEATIEALTSSSDTMKRWAFSAGPGWPRRSAPHRGPRAERAAARARRVDDAGGGGRRGAGCRGGDRGRARLGLRYERRSAPMTADQGDGEGRANRAHPAAAGEPGRASLLLSPTFVVVMAVVVIPILWTIFIAFRDLRLRDLREVGIFGAGFTLENFIGVFTSRGFFDALLTTLIYSVVGHRARHRSRAGGRAHRPGPLPRPDAGPRLDASAVRLAGCCGCVRLVGDARPEPRHRERVRRGRRWAGSAPSPSSASVRPT